MSTKTRLTNAERLAHRCPQCQANPGEKCRDYTGRAMAPHRTRGPGAQEEHYRKEAERVTARKRAAYGPLFQDLAEKEVPALTAADVAERKVQAARMAVESDRLTEKANEGIERIFVRWAFREAARFLGAEAAAKHWEYAVKVYDWKEAYMVGYLRKVLTSDQVVQWDVELRFDPARVNAVNTDGRYLADRSVWPPAGYVPPLTPAEFDRQFPAPDHKHGVGRDAPEPDDGGLYERVIGLFRESLQPQA